jgi:PKD repeat protein
VGKNSRGDEIVVAVIDEGFQLDHPDLKDVFFVNMGEQPGNGIDDDGNGYIDDVNGWNVYNNSGNLPQSSHGTHVCGIIAAKGNNAAGITGINWNLKILPVAGSSENEARVISAYSYVADLRAQYDASKGARGAFVVTTNASFGVNQGKPENFPIWCALYDSLGRYGILNAAATTNSNINVDLNGDIPTACPSLYLLGVTNSTNTDEKNAAAGFGTEHIDLAAPGTSIYSTNGGSAYGYRTGTSMSSPMVAGALGLMYAAACGEFTEDYRSNPEMKALEMRQILLEGADIPGTLGGYVAEGRRLDLEKPLIALSISPCDPMPEPRAAFTSSYTQLCQGDSIQFFNRSSVPFDLLVWDFPGGSPAGSTEREPRVEYSLPGVYPVKLVVRNGELSDTSQAESWVTIKTGDDCLPLVVSKPRASFTYSAPYLCSGSSLQLINTSSNASHFTWIAEGIKDKEALNPLLHAEQDGEVLIRLIASHGSFSDTLDTTITVKRVPRREKPTVSLLGNKLYTLSQGPLQWYLNGLPVEGATGNFIIPEKAGYYSVTVSNAWACTNSSDPWLFGVTSNGNDDIKPKSFRVGPIPVKGRLFVFSPDQRPYKIGLFDLTGKELYFESGNYGRQEILDLSEFEAGIYILQIWPEGEAKPEIFRIMKQQTE